MVLPVVFVPFIIRSPAGLALYGVTTTLWTVGQGLIPRRLIPKPAAPPKRSSRTAPREQEPEPPPATTADGDKAEDGKTTAKPAGQAKPQAQGPPRRVRRKKKRTRRGAATGRPRTLRSSRPRGRRSARRSGWRYGSSSAAFPGSTVIRSRSR